MDAPYLVQTKTFNGRQWDEIDRDETLWLNEFVGPGWAIVQIETVAHGPTDVNAQHGLSVTVRAYFRRTAAATR